MLRSDGSMPSSVRFLCADRPTSLVCRRPTSVSEADLTLVYRLGTAKTLSEMRGLSRWSSNPTRQEVVEQLSNELRAFSLPVRPSLWHHPQVAQRQRLGQGRARTSVGDISFPNDDERRCLNLLGKRFEVCWPYLIEEFGDIGGLASESLYRCRRKQAEDAVEDGANHDHLWPGIGTQHECSYPLAMSCSDVQRHHAAQAVANEYYLIGVGRRYRGKHPKRWILQDHWPGPADFDVWNDHRRKLLQSCLLSSGLGTGVPQTWQQHNRVSDAHGHKARVRATCRRCTSITGPSAKGGSECCVAPCFDYLAVTRSRIW